MDNIDINKLLKVLNEVNAQDLEKAVFQANQIMQSKKKNDLINELKKKIK